MPGTLFPTSSVSLLRSLKNFSLGQVLSQFPEVLLHFRIPGSIQQQGTAQQNLSLPPKPGSLMLPILLAVADSRG